MALILLVWSVVLMTLIYDWLILIVYCFTVNPEALFVLSITALNGRLIY
jgi:hypothetical protein|tara:strand:+ start:1114 stop:1260 length:147 start_codon:yes stop_codon:yes gene_type:complete